jgi:hypothetical protein
MVFHGGVAPALAAGKAPAGACGSTLGASAAAAAGSLLLLLWCRCYAAAASMLLVPCCCCYAAAPGLGKCVSVWLVGQWGRRWYPFVLAHARWVRHGTGTVRWNCQWRQAAAQATSAPLPPPPQAMATRT